MNNNSHDTDSDKLEENQAEGAIFQGLQDLRTFKENFIDTNRGKPLHLIRFEKIVGIELLEFVNKLRDFIDAKPQLKELEYSFHYIDSETSLLLGLTPIKLLDFDRMPNMDNSIGQFHENCNREKSASFNFGIARTQCNYISSIDEIYLQLDDLSKKNLKDNLIRWSWTVFNKANSYFSGDVNDAVIQPTIYFDKNEATFSVKGGEVFVGGTLYSGYEDLINDIPKDQDMDRIELLILEKLIIACENAPGVLKFNISPQTLIDTFSKHERVIRFNRLIHSRGLNPSRVRLELVEKAYEESDNKNIKEVCMDFFNYGITFAADDFGVKSQSHQVVLTLGQMIKEFKLDPISFKFKPDEDKTKFLDNLAFIAYCKRLADNREANITAEAVEDIETLNFLLEHKINQYQAFIFCNKLSLNDYRKKYDEMQDLPHEAVNTILNSDVLMLEQKECGNIFDVARKHKMF